MSHTLTSLEFLFTNGGNEVHTHTEPSVLASCVCTSRLNRGDFKQRLLKSGNGILSAIVNSLHFMSSNTYNKWLNVLY